MATMSEEGASATLAVRGLTTRFSDLEKLRRLQLQLMQWIRSLESGTGRAGPGRARWELWHSAPHSSNRAGNTDFRPHPRSVTLRFRPSAPFGLPPMQTTKPKFCPRLSPNNTTKNADDVRREPSFADRGWGAPRAQQRNRRATQPGATRPLA